MCLWEPDTSETNFHCCQRKIIKATTSSVGLSAHTGLMWSRFCVATFSAHRAHHQLCASEIAVEIDCVCSQEIHQIHFSASSARKRALAWRHALRRMTKIDVFLGVRLNCVRSATLADPFGFNPGARTTISYQQTFLRISTEIIIAAASLLLSPLRRFLYLQFFFSPVSASHAVIVVCVRA